MSMMSKFINAKAFFRKLALVLLAVNAQHLYADSMTYFPATFVGFITRDTVYPTAKQACDAAVDYNRSLVTDGSIFSDPVVVSTRTYNHVTVTFGYLNTHHTRCDFTYTRGSDGYIFNLYTESASIYTCPYGTFTDNSSGQQDANNPNKLQAYDTCVDQCTQWGMWADPVTGSCTQPIAKPKQTQLNPSTCMPVNVGNGNKWLKETDYNGTYMLSMVRNYTAFDNYGIKTVGAHWTANHLSHIATYTNTVSVFRTDASMKIFNYNGSLWITDADTKDKLAQTSNGWDYLVDGTDTQETYTSLGLLFSTTNRNGLTTTYSYSNLGTPNTVAYNPNLLISTTDSFGRSLNFTYDASNRISTMTNPAGGVYHYAYSADGNNNLISVTYPDSTVKQYLYEDSSHPNALTGVIDENGSRFMTYTYDANGRAVEEISPTFGTNVNHYQMNYNPGVSTTVTDPRGTVRTYNFTTILGVVKSTSQSQPAGSGCGASAAALTYDANGNIATRIDFNGSKTTYVYDLARNTETSRTEGLTAAGAATASTRTITTSWHPTWRLPLSISEYAGATASGTPLKTTTYVYDSKGNITSVSEADPVNNKTRTTITTYTYSTAVPGLVLTKVVDGPRTDVSDITTYQYYPHDATCADSTASPIIDPITGIAPDNLGCRGQLMSVTNALGQSTTYDRYNHHGQVEQMTDANGLVTTYTYDLRQRILSHTAGTEQTSYQYDNVGQLTQLTLPDGSYLNYTWDAAHRLTDITDSLSNHIHYTLDTEGNRTQEDITDPNSVLTKTLSRSYDALSRMQQLTGIE
jgi:YD repeat-containing protein